MVFTKEECFELHREEIKHGRLRVIYRNREGKNKCAWLRYQAETGEVKTFRIITRSEGKRKKFKPLKLKGPPDIISRRRYSRILEGKELNYPFLSPFENRLLTRRALGESWKTLAQRFSGGHDRRSYKTISIKNILYQLYTKVRVYERRFRSKISIDAVKVTRKKKSKRPIRGTYETDEHNNKR